MNDVNLNLNYHVQEFSSSPGATTLAVVLHAYRKTSDKMKDVNAAAEEAFGEKNVDIYSPTLSYSDPMDRAGADEIVLRLVAHLDEIWIWRCEQDRAKEDSAKTESSAAEADLDDKTSKKPGGYGKVVFIGHSLGGIILRRVFLAGSLNPPDYDKDFRARDELYQRVYQQRKSQGVADDNILPCDWAPKVERLILLASWDKGWSVSPRTGWLFSIGLNALGIVGRLIELLSTFLNALGLSELLSKLIGALPSWQPARTMLDMRQGWQPARTMLDMRQGAPFIVQTRLLWMAYRRWHNKEIREKYEHNLGVTLGDPAKRRKGGKKDGERLTVNPLVVQIIASQDDFVSPQDQVDVDAEGVGAWLPRGEAGEKAPSAKKYFMLEMESCEHKDVVKLFENETRKKLFTAALTSPREQFDENPDLSKALRNPVNFLDTPPKIDLNVEHVVFVMHGIRDDGYWTHRVAAAIKKEWAEKNTTTSSNAAEKIKFYPSWTHTYGYFAMLPFILPWIRRSKVEWFMDNYVSVKAAYPAARLHFVGHSNGTYIGACALKDYPGARFGKMYFAGSVVHPQYNWLDKFKNKQVTSFHNARGGEDWVVALLPKSLEYFTDLGGAGFDGFDETAVEKKDGRETRTWPDDKVKFTQSKLFATGGHSGAIGEKHWPEIAKFIVSGEQPFSSVTPDNGLFAAEQDRFYKFLGGLRIGVPLGFALAGLFLLLAVSFFLPDHWSWKVVLTTVAWVCWLWAARVYFKWSSTSPPPPITRIGVPLGFALAGLFLLLKGSFFLPDHWSWKVVLTTVAWVWWLWVAGVYLKSTPPRPMTTPEFYGMAGGVVILSVVSPIVLVGNPWWAVPLAVFMALQYFTKWDGGYSNQQGSQIQRAPIGFAQSLLTCLFIVLAVSFVGWLIWSIYAVLAEFGKCDVKVSIFDWRTLLFVVGELAIFVILLYHKQLAPHWLNEQFARRFLCLAGVVLGLWILFACIPIYSHYAQQCSVQFMPMRSGFAVATLFLLAGLIRFILLRV